MRHGKSEGQLCPVNVAGVYGSWPHTPVSYYQMKVKMSVNFL